MLQQAVADLAQVLTAVELARSALTTANKDVLSSLRAGSEPGCAAASSGLPVLAVDHPLVMTAAKDLATPASLQQATLQVDEPCMHRAVAVHQRSSGTSVRTTLAGFYGAQQSKWDMCRLMQQRGGGWRSARGETR